LHNEKLIDDKDEKHINLFVGIKGLLAVKRSSICHITFCCLLKVKQSFRRHSTCVFRQMDDEDVGDMFLRNIG
jgi:hypothetical protein